MFGLLCMALAGLVFLGACGDFTLFGEETLPYVELVVSPLDPQSCSTQTVTVDASGSVDPLDEALAFVWTLTVPLGSQATLADPSASKTTFSPDLAGSYLPTVMVVAERGDYATAQATVIASSDPIAAATAGATQVEVGDTVNLDGSGSKNPLNTDCSSTGLAFSWAFTETGDKPSGSSAFINPPTAAQASFIADLAGAYRATLTVTPLGQTTPASEASVTVTASAAGLTIGDLTAGDYGMTVASVTDTVFESVVDLEALLKGAVLNDPMAVPDPATGTSPFASPLPLSTDTQDLGTLDLDLAWTSVDNALYTASGTASLTVETTSLTCEADATVSSGSVTPTTETTASLALALSDVSFTGSTAAVCELGCAGCDLDGTVSFTMTGEYQLP